ncbi:hypothetical protein TIFTF001_034159 [Ficus carica]|uniref:Uncharacterized protein n=1 Tax=Ficus carica TaxID=3494 RepID=A0AA88J844_FICCA|nr:hypothetical protein TIFTF001_034159 [Ficus carica]
MVHPKSYHYEWCGINLLDVSTFRVGGLCHVLPRGVGLSLGRKLASFLNSQGTSQLCDLALHLFTFFHHLREK